MQRSLHNPFFTKNETRAYLAGLFDGEGCVHISKNFDLRVVVSMTVSEPLLLFQQEFGGSFRERKGKSLVGKKQWCWELVGKAAADFLAEVVLLLRIKQAEAVIGILAYDVRGRWGERPRRKDGTMLPLSAEEITVRESLRAECSDLKRFNA